MATNYEQQKETNNNHNNDNDNDNDNKNMTNCCYLQLMLSLCTDGTGKDLYSPEAESSPAPSFVDPTVAQLSVGIVGGVAGLGVAKPTSRTSSFEIENLLKTAEQVSFLLPPTPSILFCPPFVSLSFSRLYGESAYTQRKSAY